MDPFQTIFEAETPWCNLCESDEKTALLGCSHRFCKTCVATFWKPDNKRCPVCKRRTSKDLPDILFKEHNVTNEGVSLGDDDTAKSKQASEDLVDWRKPLAWQVGHLGEKYNEWVHQPVDRPIRLFESEFLEGRTQAAWYWVLIVWLPAIFYLSATIAGSVLWTYSYGVPMTFILGIVLWLFMVYCIHFLFHHPLSSNYYLITLHFLLHGHHHKSPNDRLRTVFPPSLAIALFTVLFMLLRCLLPDGLDMSMLLGLLCAYVFTDMVHYYLHHCKPNENSYFHDIRTIHVKHHFEQPDKGLGIATKLWDWIFNTGIHPLGCSKYTGSTTTMGRRK